MKSLVFLLLSIVLVGVQCRPAEPEVRNFGVQPDNPNVKVFFTYPTVPPRIDNPNDLEKGTQNEEKEKYVKSVLKEAVKAKGEGLSKEAAKESSVTTETLPEETNGNDQQPILQDNVTPEASSNLMQNLPSKEDAEIEKAFTKSKDFASQNAPTENLLGGFMLADTMIGEEDADAENNEEAREDVDQEGFITINQFPSAASEVSPGIPELIGPIEGDEEATENGDSEGAIVVPLSSVPLFDMSTDEADFTRHSEIDDETVDSSDNTQPPVMGISSSPSFGISVNYPDEEATAVNSPTEDSDFETQNMPIAVRETVDVKSGVPLIPLEVEMVPVVEVVEMDDSLMSHSTSELENNPEEARPERVEATEPIMDPIVEIPARVSSNINVEVMPSENMEESPMIFKERNPEMEESLLVEEKPNETMTIIEEVPLPVAKVEPNVNMPIADVEELLAANMEGIRPRIQEEDQAFLDYMSEIDDKLMEADIAVAPQTLDRLMPIIESEVPMVGDLPASVVTREWGSMINDHNVDPMTAPLEGEIIMPVEQTPKVDEIQAVESEITNNEEVSPVEELTPNETESKVLGNIKSPIEPLAPDATATADLKTKEIALEKKSAEEAPKVEAKEENKAEEKSKDSELVVPEPETEGKSTTTSVPDIDPIELALKNENYSSDDTSFNETL